MSLRSAGQAKISDGWPFVVSRGLFIITALVGMVTPAWESGTLARWPIGTLHVASRTYRVGALMALPVLTGLTWFAGYLARRPRPGLRWGPVHMIVPVFGLGAWSLARIWPIHNLHTAVVTAMAIVLFWGTYLYVLQNLPTREAAWMLSVLMLIQGGVGVAQFLKQSSVGLAVLGERALAPEMQGMSVIEVAGQRILRAYGLTPHPNILGGYLAMCLLFCLGTHPGRLRGLYWPGLLAGAAGLFASFSRAAWLGTLLGLAYMAWRLRWGHALDRRSARGRWLVIALAALIVLGGGLVVRYRELLLARLVRLDNPLESRSLAERAEDAALAWGLIRAVPFTGTGPGYYTAALWAGVRGPRPPDFRTVHSVPMLAAAELGLPGAILWLWLVCAPPMTLYLRSRRVSVSPMQAGLAGAWVCAAVVSLFDNYLYIPVTWWPAFYLGILAGLWAREYA